MDGHEAAAPDTPFIPTRVAVRVPQRTTTRTRTRADKPAKERPCWDVRYLVDGQRYFRRFDRASDADNFAADLRKGHNLGWPFDAKAKRFLDPEAGLRLTAPPPAEGQSETVFTWTDRYWRRKWPTLEPQTRSELARYLNRARRWLVDEVPEGDDADALDEYLAKVSLTVAPIDGERTDGEVWLRDHSLAMAAVGRAELERLVEHYSRHARDPSRRVSAQSIKRMVADLRPCWERAVLEEVIPTNPWARVDLGLLGSAGGKRRATTELAADADLVLDPDSIWALADACAEHGKWGPDVRGFVLTMGFCGLRPSEATSLLVGDLEVDDLDAPGWLTVRRSQRRVTGRYLDDGEDPEWGPLKGRELTDVRRVPVPSAVAAVLREQLAARATKLRGDDLVFERHGRPYNLSGFHADVWAPARAVVFPLDPDLDPDSPRQPKLARLRRHDLRHSACSLWLRAGVDVTVCQKWSGHKRLSVFLDIYQGVMPGREQEGVESLEALLAGTQRSPSRHGSASRVTRPGR